jgi:hypothetical protein
LPSFEEQIDAFYKALLGLHVNFRPGLTGFDVMVKTRVATQVFLELEWVSEAGRMKNEMAIMPSAKQIGANQFQHEEFCSPIRSARARVRLLLEGQFYPADKPAEFNYQS